jgi:catechol 2,3-dioxygenase-like lactoylglutathione lyase family enzyme
MITQIDHIEMIVKDVDAHVDFYQKLGFKLLTRTDHHGGSAELQLPGPNQPILEIHTVLGEENIGINHIAFQAEDVFDTHKELTEKKVKLDSEPYRNKHTGRGNIRLRDPDGWRLQISDKKRAAPQTGIAEEDVMEKL